jgi:glycosyltransferase involved in cell wall biosynthesis
MPAHYMAKFHAKLYSNFGVSFIYVEHLSSRSGFDHEVKTLNYPYIVVKGFSVLKVNAVLTELDPDVVVLSGHVPRINIVAGLWSVFNKKQTLYFSDTNRKMEMSWPKSLFKYLLLRFLLGESRVVIFTGHENKSFLQDVLGGNINNRRWIKVPLPHDHKFFATTRSSGSKKQQPFNFLFVGRLALEKGVENLLIAASILSSQSELRYKLSIAGGGKQENHLKELTQRLGLTSIVDFLGVVPSDKVQRLYKLCDVVVVPSGHEPWGLVVNEALSSGKPVILPYWVGAASDLMIDGENGFVVQNNEPPELANAMFKALKNREKTAKMGRFGQEFMKKNGWTVENSVEGFGKVLRDLQK